MRAFALLLLLFLGACAGAPGPAVAVLDLDGFVKPDSRQITFSSKGPEVTEVRFRGQTLGRVEPGQSAVFDVEHKP